MKQLNKLMTLVVILLMLGSSSLEAQTITVGTGTTSSGTSIASPINIWYRSLHYQTVYTAAELTAAGATAGSILQMGFDVTGVPTYALPNYTIQMKHTTAADAAVYDAVGLMQVYNTPSYTPTIGGFDMITLQIPFSWNGLDNILIDICFDQVTAYAQAGTVTIYSATGGANYARLDSAPQCGVASNSTLQEKPVIQFLMGVPPACSMPGLPGFTNLTSTSVDAAWAPTGTPTSYIVEYGPLGFAAGTGTTLTPTTAMVSIPSLTPATDYTLRVQAVCGTSVGDTSFAAVANFSTDCPSTMTAPITESFGGAGVVCLTSTNGMINSGGGWQNVGWVSAASSGSSAPASYDGDNFMYLETQGGTAGQDDTLHFLPIDLTALTSPFLDFYWFLDYQWGASGSFDVQVADGNGVWTSVFSRSGGQNTFDWKYSSVDLSAYAGMTIGLRIIGVVSGGSEGGAAIDNLRVKEAPASACSPIMAPDTTTFEDGGALNACWEQGTMDVLNWTINTGGTPTTGTGPSAANGGSYYAYLESSAPAMAGDSAILVSPPFNTSGLADAPALYFNYHMFGNNTMKLRVELEIFGSDVWVPVWEQVGGVQTLETDAYEEAYIPLPSAAGTTMRVRFVAVVGTGADATKSDIAIDDIRVQNVLAHDVLISRVLTPGNNCGLGVQAVTVEVVNRGFNPQSAVPVFVSVNGGTAIGASIPGPIAGNGGIGTVDVLVDMTALGAYDIVAHTALANDEITTNDEVQAMAYHQPHITGEFDEHFEMGNGNWYAEGDFEHGMPTGTVISGAAAGASAYVTNLSGNYTDGVTSYLYSPCYDISTMTQPILRFSVNWDLENDMDAAWLDYSIDGGTTWAKLGANSFAGVSWYTDSIANNNIGWAWNGTGTEGSGGWLDSYVDLQPYGLTSGTDVRFRFVVSTDGANNQEGFGVDNFGVFNACLDAVANETIVDVSVDGANDGSITLNPIGGFGGYSFLWADGTTSNSISGLAAGTYDVTITDQSTCVTTASFTVSSLCPTSLGLSTTVTPEIGDNGANGSALITATMGTAPYTYTWANGSTSNNVFDLSNGTYNIVVTDANGCTESIDAIIDLVYLTGTENIDGLTGLLVAPNPAKNYTQLDINFENAVDLTVNLIDVTGRILETRHQGNTTNEQMRFDVSNLAEGMYFLKITANGQSTAKRFVVVK